MRDFANIANTFRDPLEAPWYFQTTNDPWCAFWDYPVPRKPNHYLLFSYFRTMVTDVGSLTIEYLYPGAIWRQRRRQPAFINDD